MPGAGYTATRRLVLSFAAGRSLAAVVALAAAALAAAALLAAPPAEAAPGKPRILAPQGGKLVTGNALRVRIRAGGPRPRLLVGNRDVTRGLRSAGGGTLVVTLRRGKHLRRGMNRIVASSGRGRDRRYTARTVIVGARKRGALRVKQRRRTRAALRLWVGSARRAEFRYVAVKLNGSRVRTRDWIPGTTTRATRWPLGRKSFDALFGADDGLRFGRNRIVITAWGEDGFYDRAVRTVTVSRRAPLVSARGGRRLPVGRKVVFDGSRTRPAPGRGVAYEWRIVRQPRGSKARLRGTRGARPWLRPDRNGRYRVRLFARHTGRGAAASAVGPAATDELTVEATPAIPPLGAPVRTITEDGAIEVLGRKYYAAPGAWAQILKLDRATLEVVGNESVEMPVENLEYGLGDGGGDHLVIVSGGNREVQPTTRRPGEVAPLQVFVRALGEIGVIAENAYFNWRRTAERALAGGRWSAIGVPEAYESGTGNVFGMIYGAGAGAGSQPGALTGYLQQDAHRNFHFVSANRTAVNTNLPGSPPGVNSIQVGSQVFTGQIPADASGFHVVVLDSMLNPTAERTFVTNPGGGYDEGAVAAMQEFISNASAPEVGAPGYLVIVQSIGNPRGFGPEWVDDEVLANDTYMPETGREIEPGPEVWSAPAGVGTTLAGAIGELAGQAAHDMIAQMAGPAPAPEPAPPGGFSLVASVGQLYTEYGPADPGSRPQARAQAASTARIAGELSRDRQSLWKIDTPAYSAEYAVPEAAQILYQEPTEWPLSKTAAQRAANAYIARKVKLGVPDARAAYYEKTSNDWANIKGEIKEVPYPEAAEGFNRATFLAVREQLAREAGYVANVWSLIKEWRSIFNTSAGTSYIDLQSMAIRIEGEIEQLSKKSGTSAEIMGIVSDVLWVASGIPDDGVSFAAGALAAGMDMAIELSSSPEGSELLGPVRATVANLGEELARNAGAATAGIDTIGAILVSDWGKLQAASAAAKGHWAFNYEEESDKIEALVKSSEIEFNAALLSTVYREYVVDPPAIMNSTSRQAPWNVDCEGIDPEQTGHFFGSENEAPYSWVTLPAAIGGSENHRLWYGLTTKGSMEGGQVVHRAHILSDKISRNLFAPGGLGANPIEFFADPRFTRHWFSCQPH